MERVFWGLGFGWSGFANAIYRSLPQVQGSRAVRRLLFAPGPAARAGFSTGSGQTTTRSLYVYLQEERHRFISLLVVQRHRFISHGVTDSSHLKCLIHCKLWKNADVEWSYCPEGNCRAGMTGCAEGSIPTHFSEKVTLTSLRNGSTSPHASLTLERNWRTFL